MLLLGLSFALLSGIANGLFSFPMKVIPSWKWENIWLVFILTACVAIPLVMTGGAVDDLPGTLAALPRGPVAAALVFGFAWGFGAILFGLSVDRLGVSLANSLVIGLSSALGAVVPLLLSGQFRLEARQVVLFAGVLTFIVGVGLCARAGRLREGQGKASPSLRGFIFACGSGVLSAVFNIGYSLALPIAATGQTLGLSSFTSTNLIWLLMLLAGSVPNIVFCAYLMRAHGSARLFTAAQPLRTWFPAMMMGILWGASIYLYGVATPLLGDIGPSIGWPLSLAVGLLIANLMGYLLGEWKGTDKRAVRLMQGGIGTLLVAIAICALSTRV